MHRLPRHRLPVRLRAGRGPARTECSSIRLRLRPGLRVHGRRARLHLHHHHRRRI